MTFWSRLTRSFSANKRATTSTEPPGGNPTKTFTVGLSCANAEVHKPVTAKLALKITNFKRFLFMRFLIAIELISPDAA
jgi:hypothetical protein